MQNTYNLQSTDCGPLGTADKILITVGGFNLLEDKCTINYTLIDSVNNIKVAQGYKIMGGTDYDNWGQDNTYVKNWLFSQLGLIAA